MLRRLLALALLCSPTMAGDNPHTVDQSKICFIEVENGFEAVECPKSKPKPLTTRWGFVEWVDKESLGYCVGSKNKYPDNFKNAPPCSEMLKMWMEIGFRSDGVVVWR